MTRNGYPEHLRSLVEGYLASDVQGAAGGSHYPMGVVTRGRGDTVDFDFALEAHPPTLDVVGKAAISRGSWPSARRIPLR